MSDAGVRYLLSRVGLIEDRIRALVLHRRADDPAPDDPFRGLYLTEEVVDQLLAPPGPAPTADLAQRRHVEDAADAAERGGATIRLRRLAAGAGLTQLDVEILVISMVPDLDSRFERLYGYLNDDVTRRRATVGLALTLADAPSASSGARARLLPGAPLIDRALVQVDDADRPFLTRALRVPDRVSAHLLGDDGTDPALVGLLTEPVRFDCDRSAGLARALTAGQRLFYVRESGIGIGPALGAAALLSSGRPVLGVDLSRMAARRAPDEIVTVLGREALLRGAGVVAGPVEALSGTGADALRMLADLPVPVTIVGTATWDPNWTDSVPLVIDAPTLTPSERVDLWVGALRELSVPAGSRPGGTRDAGSAAVTGAPVTGTGQGDGDGDGHGDVDVDPAVIPAHFVLGPGQVNRAVRAATAAARASSRCSWSTRRPSGSCRTSAPGACSPPRGCSAAIPARPPTSTTSTAPT